MKFYLSGGMEYKKNLGMAWRVWLTAELEKLKHDGIDPVKLEAPSTNGKPIQDTLTELKLAGRFDEVRKVVREALIRKDMYGIQLSDALVVLYDDSVRRGAGTISEAWEAFREGKPVYLVTDFPVRSIPTWLIGETTQIFYDFEELLEYVSDHSRVVEDSVKARKARDEVLAGIY